ncbi:MAG: heparinase II/III family protein [bacterium]|nr:heparinase II/III family protein [bacterium]
MPGWNSQGERECRQRIEKQKTKFTRSAGKVDHPCLRIRDKNLDIAQANIRRHDWAKQQYDGMTELADHYAGRSNAWIDLMVPDLTPLHIYGTYCPACEADNTWSMAWDYRDPEKLTCSFCGAVMTGAEYPEQGLLELPRSGQTLSYYLRPDEINDRKFSTGRNAFVWAGRKVHTSYQGAIRQRKTHHMPGAARTLAILYRMTGKDSYARTAAAILKRFAKVYPNYLLHDYWNTFLDCDPLYACELMAKDQGLSRFEVNACPDQPHRPSMKSGKIIHTFWGCGRLSCGGVNAEANQITNLAEALDLLWDQKDSTGQPFLTNEERNTVISDLIVEGLLTFTLWEGINNKVAGCRVGEAALGRFLGAPEFVHRGVEGFEPFIKGFFKFDGTTAEGASYYLYALSNIKDLPEAAQGYTDPPSYRKKDHYRNLNLYEANGSYAAVFRARTLMTLPDGRTPHTADAIAAPGGWPAPAWLHNLGLVRSGKEFASFVWPDNGDDFAFFNRPASFKTLPPPPVRDRFFPGWLLAIFNTGYERMFQGDLTGTATFLMNFYEPEGHSHADALNIAMITEGVEVLSDLGYLGDHPLSSSIRSTLKHNLVVVDESEQLPRGKRPPGSLTLLATSPTVKTIEAECNAYKQTESYRRHCVMVHRGRGPAYVVDCFRVKGGKTHDYAIHGEGTLSTPPSAGSKPIALKKRNGVLGNDIQKLRAGKPGETPWLTSWTHENLSMHVHFVSPVDEILLGEGPGPQDRLHDNVTHEYLFARKHESGKGNTFVTLIDHARGTPDITGVEALKLPDGADGPAAIRVTRRTGTDLIVQSQDGTENTFGDVTFSGRTAVYSREHNGHQSLFLAEASAFSAPDLTVSLEYPVQEGDIDSSDETSFCTSVPIRTAAALPGAFVQVEDPQQKCQTAYTVKSVRGRKITVEDFSFNSGTHFRIPTTFSIEEKSRNTFHFYATAPAEIKIRTHRKKATLEQNGKLSATLNARSSNGWLSFRIAPEHLKLQNLVLRLR